MNMTNSHLSEIIITINSFCKLQFLFQYWDYDSFGSNTFSVSLLALWYEFVITEWMQQWMCRRTSITLADWLTVTCSYSWENLIGCLTLTEYPIFGKITKGWERIIYQPRFMVTHMVWSYVLLIPHELLRCGNVRAFLFLTVRFHCQIIDSELRDI
jgi:hypothetical protein